MDATEDWARARVLRFLAEGSGRSPDSIQLDEPLTAFDADSLSYVVFVMDLEDEHDIEISDPPRLVTVKDLIDFVRSSKA
jgi:acyl carrier protein